MATRSITLRLYPTGAQLASMETIRRHHAELYNAALQERRDAWRKQRVSIGRFAQERSLTHLRAEMPELKQFGRMTQVRTLVRVELAMQAFFRRVKAGHAPGFPRFKSVRRFKGWSHVRDGFKYAPKVTADGRWFNGKLYLDGVGWVRARGKARNPANRILQVDISRRQGQWQASLCCDVEAKRERKRGLVGGMDWGVTTLLTMAYGPGKYVELPNDRLFQKQQARQAASARAASKSLRGKRSKTAQKKHLRIARLHAKLGNQRKDRAHKLSATLAEHHRTLATEKVAVANMTRSAKGTVDKPGKKVAQKAGLSREILDTAPAMLLQLLRYKAEEAGCTVLLADPRRHKPSQTCPACGVRAKKTLAQREHQCGCGFAAGRDQAAALVLYNLARAYHEGVEDARSGAPETPPRAA